MQLKLVKLEADEDNYMVEIRADVAQQIRSVHLLHVTKCLFMWRSLGLLYGRQFALIPILIPLPLLTIMIKLDFNLSAWLRRLQKNILCTS